MTTWCWEALNKGVLLCFFLFVSLAWGGEFHVVTVASDYRKEIDYLKASAAANGLEVTVLGIDRPWGGVGTKFVILNEYLQNLSDDDVVLFVDAFDVDILGNREEFLALLRQKKAPLILAAERVLWGPEVPAKSRKAYPPSPTSFRYVNSGTILGYAGYLKQMLKELDLPSNGCFFDQNYLHLYFLNHQDQIYLDRYVEVFFPLHGVELEELKFDLDHRKIYVKETQTCPLVAHGNGGGRWLYEMITKLFFLHTLVPPTSLESFTHEPHLYTQMHSKVGF